MSTHLTKLFNIKNLKLLEEEKPRAYNQIQQTQFNRFTFNPKFINDNKDNFNSYDLKPELSARSKKIQHNNISNNNIMKSFKNDNNNINNIDKNMKTYSSAYFNEDKFKIRNSDYIDDKNVLELIFNKLGIGNIYLEKIFSNKIDFNDFLLLNKEDLQEMKIPIGPRNRILSFIKNYILYKENNNNDNFYSVNQFFNLNILKVNNSNSIFLNHNISNENLYKIKSATINIKTKYNNNFSTNVDNEFHIKNQIKNYLNNNPNNLTINVNKVFKKKSNCNSKKKDNPFTSENSQNEKHKRANTIENIYESYENFFHKNQGKNILNMNEKSKNIFFNVKKYKKNPKIKYDSGNNYLKNIKQIINNDILNSKSHSKNKTKKLIGEKKNKHKNHTIEKSLNSFSDEGLNLLNKMKENLNTKIKDYTKSIGEKKLLLKLIEGKNNDNI